MGALGSHIAFIASVFGMEYDAAIEIIFYKYCYPMLKIVSLSIMTPTFYHNVVMENIKWYKIYSIELVIGTTCERRTTKIKHRGVIGLYMTIEYY